MVSRRLYADIIAKIRQSRLIKDSLWAVVGSGVGYALILLAGIIVAALLGSSKFGEYGFVKSTMFQFATFATLGLHFTSTKFISENREKNPDRLASISKSALIITLVTSVICAAVICFGANPIASLLDHKEFANSLKLMGVIVIFRSIATTQYGILGGFGDFRIIARNNIVSGIVMLSASAVGAWLWGLSGALAALILSQFFNAVINSYVLRIKIKSLPKQINRSYIKEELRFTLPVALQDISANIVNFLLIFLIARFSSWSQLGIYTAAQQWYVVAIFIPSLLQNVILSHLSKETDNRQLHQNKFNNIVRATFLATLVTSIVLICISPLITRFYGTTFIGLSRVIIMLLLLASVSCVTGVYKSGLISSGRIWQLFSARFVRDLICVILSVMVLTRSPEESAAFYVSIVCLSSELLYLVMLSFINRSTSRSN